jgi:Secretion system C-terminal sorting domain
MKRIYTTVNIRILLLSLSIFLIQQHSNAQCPDGQPAGGTAFDTTITLGSGVVSTQLKFPKFDPQSGMVTCVRLCVTIRGIIDTVALENFSNAAQTGSYTYTRRDTVTGPGIPTFLTSSANLSFGPFPLGATNGVFGSGPDFYSIGSDTVLTRVLCSNVSDSATIAQFYGAGDSVTYDYVVDANAIGAVTGGSSLAFVLSSAKVNFRFEYCTCPPTLLPLNVKAFDVNKIAAAKVELKWTGYDDPYANYHYEAEMSRDRQNFSTIGSVDKKANGDGYRLNYTANSENGTYYFRIKQVYSNGYVRYSNIKQVALETSAAPKFSVFPNPSSGIVGIKFDNNVSGQFDIQIYNTQGQTIVQKGIVVSAGALYAEVATLKSGIYWIRLTDKLTQESGVNQLFIK